MTHAHAFIISGLPAGSTILMLTTVGSDWFAATSAGLFRSTDGGQSWIDVLVAAGITEGLIVPSVAVSPTYSMDHTVFAGVAGGILRSTDGGATWTLANAPKPDPVISSLALSPNFAQDGQLYAGTVEDGVLQSSDRGTSWISWNFQLVDLSILSLAISPDFIFDHALYTGTSTGIFGSRTAGRAWHEINLPCGYAAVMSLLALGDGVLLAGTEQNGLYRSTDGGKSWLQAGQPESATILALVEGAEGWVAANTVAGLLLSPDSGLTWRGGGLELPEGVDISALAALDNGWLIALSDGTLQVVE